MVCSLTVAGIWQVGKATHPGIRDTWFPVLSRRTVQVLSSYLEFNTSSTHSIVGCIIGFSLCYAGPKGGNSDQYWVIGAIGTVELPISGILRMPMYPSVCLAGVLWSQPDPTAFPPVKVSMWYQPDPTAFPPVKVSM